MHDVRSVFVLDCLGQGCLGKGCLGQGCFGRARVGAQSGLGPGPGWGPYGPIGPLWAHKGPYGPIRARFWLKNNDLN